jgi:hypothetical protein
MEDMTDDMTVMPLMRNLHAFDWVCPDGHRHYQDQGGTCRECGKPMTKDIKWIGKKNPQSFAFRFDKDLHFQYWGEYKQRQTGDLVETMTIPGSCFMLTREKYLELDICEEAYGNWGQQGVEVACKTWLSGGKMMVNKKCWYAHMFRTTPNFTFPWPASGSSQQKARELSKDIWMNNKWPKAIHNFQWLIDKFAPVPGWETPTRGIIYYTDNELDPKIMKKVQDQLMQVESSTLPIVSVSLKPIEFGTNYVLNLERGHLTMTKQIIKALEESNAEVIFFCEHDILYHPSHFDFTPPRKDTFYYNMNSWMLRAEDGHAVYFDHKSLSGLVAYRELLLTHYRERLRRIELLIAEANGTDKVRSMKDTSTFISLKEGIHRLGFEPGSHNRIDKIDDVLAEGYRSKVPNVDIRHKNNFTQSRWSKEEFRRPSSYQGWKESDRIPWWGRGRKIL